MPFPFSYISNNITKGLITWWKFDEGVGITVKDSSGNGNTGTLTNSPSWVNGYLPGKAVSFIAANSQSIAPAKLINIPYVSMSCWVKFNSFPTTQTIMGCTNGVGSGVDDKVIYINTSGLLSFYIFTGGGGQTTPSPSTALTINKWYFITATYDGNNMFLYVNAQKIASKSATGGSYTGYTVPNFFASVNILNIGSYLNGILDDVRLYNRGLSSREVLALYQWTAAF